VPDFIGAPEEIRTPDPQIRSLELRSAQESDYLPFPALRDSGANTFRTSDWEIPNCLAMREGAIPALKLASTAFI